MTDSSLSRRQALASLSAGAAIAALPGCARSLKGALPVASEAEALALLDSVAENLLALSPESATALGVDTGARAPLRSQLRDRSAAGQQKLRNLLMADLSRVNAVDAGALSHSTRTSIEVVRSAYGTALEGFALPYGDVPVAYDSWRKTPYVVIQNVGAYLDLPRFLDSEHKVESATDAEAYLARLSSYPRQLDGELGRVRAAREQGLVPPAFLLDKAISQLRQALKSSRDGGSLVESLTRRTAKLGLAGDWEARAKAITRRDVAPAIARQISELEAQRAVATNDAGMWARPHGDAYYRWALKASTTTAMTPDEVHRMGVAELRDLHGRMEPILRGLGYTKGSLGARMTALANDPRFKFPEGDKGRAEIIAFLEERLAIIRKEMPRAFRTLVRGNVEVKRLPPDEEPGAPGAYGGAGSIDGSIPGKLWINLGSTGLHNRFDLPDLAHHEAIPGHVWQGEYSNQLPLIRTILAFNAYSEGWALYAQQLADELGVYDDFPAGRLGYLQGLSYRASRLVVDTGLHAMRWTREQARQSFQEATGRSQSEAASEIDRYCSWPGQACGYKVGHSEIVRQRARAQAAIGPRYDLRDFNDMVVKGGNVPLDVLAKNVDAYIAGARA